MQESNKITALDELADLIVGRVYTLHGEFSPLIVKGVWKMLGSPYISFIYPYAEGSISKPLSCLSNMEPVPVRSLNADLAQALAFFEIEQELYKTKAQLPQ